MSESAAYRVMILGNPCLLTQDSPGSESTGSSHPGPAICPSSAPQKPLLTQLPVFLCPSLEDVYPGPTGHWPCSTDVGLLWSRPCSCAHSGPPGSEVPAPDQMPPYVGHSVLEAGQRPRRCSCCCGQTRLLHVARVWSRTCDHRGCHLLETLRGHALGRPFQTPGGSHDVSMCQLRWATRLPDVWFSVTLGVTVLLDEVSV